MGRKSIELILFIVLIFLLAFFLYKGATSSGYNWQWFRIDEFFLKFDKGKLILGPFLKGLLITFQISFLSFILTNVLGFTFGIFRVLNSFVARLLGYLYVEIFRNTPLIIQILFFYFVIAPVFNISGFWSAVIALSLFEGAYACEIVRAGIESIDKGQWEASFSLGLSKGNTISYIILPQAIKKVMLPLTNIFVSLIKDSALVSVIAVYDLTMEAQKAISETFMTFEIWLTVAFTYFLINVIILIMLRLFSYKMRWGDV
ncbi:amino acid ABC transporter permease [Deferribacter autotrophicus]|uniref:Amino acid ABC transporter permease n=1 Tax=Deferribacter autotrophicus TaxID=500465 RepID=A0A5A8F0K6_9BACT|nr:amino acid ABC transporter permease [Deferribacter autotrophicus]KAA0257398.1 amino acid ABC transporter permease [Deferribacter autotrophicus]